MKVKSKAGHAAAIIKRETSTADISCALPRTDCQTYQPTENDPEIKQETDAFPACANSHNSKFNSLGFYESDDAATPMDTTDDDVKQETDTENGTSGLQQATGQFNAYQCAVCQRKLENLTSVLDHHMKEHNKVYYRELPKYIDLEPDIDDPRYYCKACDMKHASRTEYREHLKRQHYMVLNPLRAKVVRDGATPPDPNDPNFYCSACQFQYNNKASFVKHMGVGHKMRPTPMRIKKMNPDITPDWDDPNWYCRSCDHTYKSKDSYNLHCQNAHGMIPAPKGVVKVEESDSKGMGKHCKLCQITYKTVAGYKTHYRVAHEKKPSASANSDKVPDPFDPNIYCNVCERKFSEKYNFRRHVLKMHKVDYRTYKPDINDPNFYCRVCNKTMTSKRAFMMHLLSVHSIDTFAHNSKDAEPDVYDSTNHCRTCQYTFTSKTKYQVHLKLKHRIILTPSGQQYVTSLPDPHDPNFHCSVCVKTFKTLTKFRHHCRHSHLMVLDAANIPDPGATIDVDHPDFYCSQCKRNFAKKRYFKSHLETVHKLDVDL